MNQNKIDSIMFTVANSIAEFSEDESTKTASVIALDSLIVSTGYNGLPRGVECTAARCLRPDKYMYFEHGERNAIYNAARVGASLENCTLYVLGVPCADCMRAIIQSGILEVVISSYASTPVRWMKSCSAGLEMAQDAGVCVRLSHEFKEMAGEIIKFFDQELQKEPTA